MADVQQPGKSTLQCSRGPLDELVMRPLRQRTLTSTIVIKLGNLFVRSDLPLLLNRHYRYIVHRP